MTVLGYNSAGRHYRLLAIQKGVGEHADVNVAGGGKTHVKSCVVSLFEA